MHAYIHTYIYIHTYKQTETQIYIHAIAIRIFKVRFGFDSIEILMKTIYKYNSITK